MTQSRVFFRRKAPLFATVVAYCEGTGTALPCRSVDTSCALTRSHCQCRFSPSSSKTLPTTSDTVMSAVSTTGLVLSLLGLTSLAGAGIAVGSGVSMVSFLPFQFAPLPHDAIRLNRGISWKADSFFPGCRCTSRWPLRRARRQHLQCRLLPRQRGRSRCSAASQQRLSRWGGQTLVSSAHSSPSIGEAAKAELPIWAAFWCTS